MFFKKEKKRKEKEKKKEKKGKEPDKLTLLKQQVLKRIKLIHEQILEDKIEDGFINLFHTIRIFFAIIFRIKYEFTYEELVNELGKKKKIPPELKEAIKVFANKISVIEYSDQLLSKQLLKESLLDFKHILAVLTRRKKEKKEGEIKGKVKLKILHNLHGHTLKLLHTLKLYKTEEERKEIEKKKKKEKIKKEKEVKLLKKEYDKQKAIENLANKALRFIDNKNIDMAKKTYISLNRLYQDSDPEAKAQLYDKVKDVYHEIVTYTSIHPKEEKITPLEKIKISEQRLNNLLLNIHDTIKKKDIKKAKILYAICYKLHTKLSLNERKNIYPKLKKIHHILNTYK